MAQVFHQSGIESLHWQLVMLRLCTRATFAVGHIYNRFEVPPIHAEHLPWKSCEGILISIWARIGGAMCSPESHSRGAPCRGGGFSALRWHQCRHPGCCTTARLCRSESPWRTLLPAPLHRRQALRARLYIRADTSRKTDMDVWGCSGAWRQALRAGPRIRGQGLFAL